jgi:hypothetical protein
MNLVDGFYKYIGEIEIGFCYYQLCKAGKMFYLTTATNSGFRIEQQCNIKDYGSKEDAISEMIIKEEQELQQLELQG